VPGVHGEGVNRDLAYAGGHEHTRASVNGEAPHTYWPPVTQLSRREDGHWKLAYQYADTLPSQMGDGVRVGR
jgi:ketosteroid isomerase-like protein